MCHFIPEFPRGLEPGLFERVTLSRATFLGVLVFPVSSAHPHQCSQNHLQKKLLEFSSRGLLLGEPKTTVCCPTRGASVLKQIGSLTVTRETSDEGILMNKTVMWGNKRPPGAFPAASLGGHTSSLF